MSQKTFKHINVDLGYDDLQTLNLENKRVYVTPSGAHYPSITSVLGAGPKPFLDEWKKRVGEAEASRICHHAVTRGTALHLLAERYLNNERDIVDKDTMPHVKFSFKTLRPILDNHVDEIYAQECPLYSDYLGVAGRVDCVAKYNNRLSIIDFKTSKMVKTKDQIENYFMQACAYAIMFEERTKHPVSQLVIAMVVDDHSCPLVFIEKRDNWVKPLLKAISYAKSLETNK
jgi:hypothetical protein